MDYHLKKLYFFKNRKNFLNAMQIISRKNSLSLARNRKKKIYSVMTSITMFPQSQNPSNFVRI